jgi:S-DNA-T family DNA segregation ATPase FtsK/SpoIIIE
VVERDPLARASLWPGPQIRSVAQPVPLGPFEDASPMLLPIAGQCVLIAGLRGSGKSGVLHVCIGELAACPDVVLWGLDLKQGLELDPWAGVFDRLARTPTEADQLLAAAERIREARGQLLAQDPTAEAWAPTPARPALVVVIDEQGRLRQSPSAIERLERLATLGRAYGIWLVSATQYPTVDVLGSSELRSQYTAVVLLRIQRKQHVNVVLGEGMASAGWAAHDIDPARPGVCYLYAPGSTSPKLGRAWRVTRDMIARTVNRYGGPQRTRLDPDSARAAGVPRAHAPSADSTPPARPAGQPWPPADPAGTPTVVVPGPAPNPVQILLEVLAAAGPTGRTIGELVTLTGMSRSWLYARLRELTASGRVDQVDRGRWRHPTPPTSPPPDHAL